MAIVNILDSENNVIGTLTVPDNLSQQEIDELLEIYATENPIPEEQPLINSTNVGETSPITTSSSTESIVGNMQLQPSKGKYIAIFSGNIYTGGASAQGEFGIYLNDILISDTRREIKCNLSLLGGLVTISLNTIGVGTYTATQVELSGGDIISVKFKSNNGLSIGFAERTFMLLQVQ